MKEYVVGVDLGGTKVEVCLMDETRKVIRRCRRWSRPEKGLVSIIDTIEDVIAEVADGVSFVAVGIGTPGTLLHETQRLYGSPHTPIYETPGFMDLLAQRLSVPLIVENDANCLALAEYFEACQGIYSHMMAVVLGTGMGSGLILNGCLYRGAHGGAGEIGHSVIDINGRLCNCGRKGCAEAYLSGPGIERRYIDMGGDACAVPEIFRRRVEGEPRAVELFRESTHILANVLSNCVNIFDLQAIILGGGVSNLPIWYEELPELMTPQLFGVSRRPIPVLQARLGDSAGVLGAAYLALRHMDRMVF